MVELKNEIDLFIYGVKPALLLERGTYDDIKDRVPESCHIHDKHKNRLVLLTQEWVENPFEGNKMSDFELGMYLGYYPKSCKKFTRAADEIDTPLGTEQQFIDFNGMRYNAAGFLLESIDWCLEKYGKKIIELQGYVKVIASISSYYPSTSEIEFKKDVSTEPLIYKLDEKGEIYLSNPDFKMNITTRGSKVHDKVAAW